MADAAASPSRWNNALLDSTRLRGDPLADQVVSDLFANDDLGPVNELMRNLVVNEYPPPESLPRSLLQYVTETDVLPAWADPAKIAAGERVFWRFGPQLILILNCYSLPFCYLGQNGVNALVLTSRLVTNPNRRVLETAQMVVDVMQRGGLTAPQGRGRRTIQKVRLMHAAIRKLALSGAWPSHYGAPLNQEDLAGTLMAFSWVSLDGLAKLGIELSDDEQEAYLHCWRVVGQLIGITAELLPESACDASALTSAIALHQFGPSDEGKQLTQSLNSMLDYILPGTVLKHAPAVLMRYFLGPQWAAWLGIEESKLSELACASLRLIDCEFGKLLEDSKLARALAERVGHLLIESIVYVERGGNRPSFSIPAELRQQWGVNWQS